MDDRKTVNRKDPYWSLRDPQADDLKCAGNLAGRSHELLLHHTQGGPVSNIPNILPRLHSLPSLKAPVMQSSFPSRRQDQNLREWSSSVNIWPKKHHVEHSISNWLHYILFSASLTNIYKDTNSCTTSIYSLLLTGGSSVITAGTETQSASDLECSGKLYSCDKDATEHAWNSRSDH